MKTLLTVGLSLQDAGLDRPHYGYLMRGWNLWHIYWLSQCFQARFYIVFLMMPEIEKSVGQ